MAEQTLEAWLAELEMERAKLDLMIAGVRQRLGMGSSGEANGSLAQILAGASGASTSATPGTMRADEFFQMSVPEAIKKFLGIMKQPQQPKAIADALKTHGLLTNAKRFDATVQTALQRLGDSGVVVNQPGRGWGLSEWYRGRAGVRKETKAKGRNKQKGAKKRGRPKGSARKQSTAGTKSESGKPNYREFVSERSKAGKNLKEIGEEWRQQKAKTS